MKKNNWNLLKIVINIWHSSIQCFTTYNIHIQILIICQDTINQSSNQANEQFLILIILSINILLFLERLPRLSTKVRNLSKLCKNQLTYRSSWQLSRKRDDKESNRGSFPFLCFPSLVSLDECKQRLEIRDMFISIFCWFSFFFYVILMLYYGTVEKKNNSLYLKICTLYQVRFNDL